MDIIYIIDFDGNFIDANTNALNRFGYTREELPSLSVDSLMDKNQLPLALKIIQEIKKYGVQRDLLEIRLRHKDGTPIYIESKGSAVISNGKAIAIQSIARDITERKAVEKKLLESEKYFKEITENSSDIIFITDKNGNIKYCSRSIERFSGYTPEELIGKSGFILIHPDDRERAVNDYSAAILLRDTAIPNGFRVIHKDGSERYFEGLGKNLLDNPDVAGFIMNVHDATESKRAEKKLLQTLDNLRKAFGVTMQVMVSAVEMIDPYTAGHQIRAADLARAIATEMGLSQEQIDGIRIASTIHDIGKLSIPAEILSKPTKLTEIEFSLVKEHSHSGYEMLKDVESPWPLAEIIHQHHERMNGTGYPKNLKGDEIIIEARILAVADVVEAMASHRPYRASLGIEAAVEEIEKNKGILYDDTVADACLRLFREKKYQLQ
jgi:PAS domain S-box-containing protein